MPDRGAGGGETGPSSGQRTDAVGFGIHLPGLTGLPAFFRGDPPFQIGGCAGRSLSVSATFSAGATAAGEGISLKSFHIGTMSTASNNTAVRLPPRARSGTENVFRSKSEKASIRLRSAGLAVSRKIRSTSRSSACGISRGGGLAARKAIISLKVRRLSPHSEQLSTCDAICSPESRMLRCKTIQLFIVRMKGLGMLPQERIQPLQGLQFKPADSAFLQMTARSLSASASRCPRHRRGAEQLPSLQDRHRPNESSVGRLPEVRCSITAGHVDKHLAA